MSSTPLRPRRTFLNTVRKSRLSVDPAQAPENTAPASPPHTPPPPSHSSAHRHHQHVIPNTRGRTVTTRDRPIRPTRRAAEAASGQWNLVIKFQNERRSKDSGIRPQEATPATPARLLDLLLFSPLLKMIHPPASAPKSEAQVRALPRVGHSTSKKEEERAGEGGRKERKKERECF